MVYYYYGIVEVLHLATHSPQAFSSASSLFLPSLFRLRHFNPGEGVSQALYAFVLCTPNKCLQCRFGHCKRPKVVQD